MKKPLLSKSNIWNMSVGFLGIQMGFALQNSNASRMLQTFGADVHHLSWFWLVAPLTGLIVQPIIGHLSDNTWTKLGRRKPFFLIGAILASMGLILMPNAGMFAAVIPAIWVGAGFLMIMDASFNIAMEPFRALVADNLPTEQRTEGFSAQTVLIGIGAVAGSWLPYVFAEWFGMEKVAPENEIPANVLWSFVVGAVVLISSILYTINKTKEYSPEELIKFEKNEEGSSTATESTAKKALTQLGFVQFFSWFGLFGMWVYTTSAIAQHIYKLPVEDNKSEAFNDAGNWVGIIFGVYNLVSAIYAFFLLPRLAAKYGRKKAHMISLILGALGFFSFYFIQDKNTLILSMIGVGAAWASILAMPYAILAGSLPIKKMGVYMGIFNMAITIPQILSALTLGPILKHLFNDKAIYVILLSGICFILAAVATHFVEDKDEIIVK